MERLQAFLNEIDAVKKILNRSKSKTISRNELKERIVELYKVWVMQISPIIQDNGVLLETSKTLTSLFELLLSLTSRASLVSRYRKLINQIHKDYYKNVILFLDTYSNSLASNDTIIIRNSEYATSDDLSNIIGIPLSFIPKSLVGYTKDFRSFLNTNKFDYNVFIMIKYRDSNKELLTSISSVVKKNGFNPIIAKDKKITDDLYNPIACLLCCKYGIAIYDDPEPEQEFNPNVAYELAIMHFLQRELLLLKSNNLKIPPADILHKLYEPYKTITEASSIVNTWLEKLIVEP